MKRVEVITLLGNKNLPFSVFCLRSFVKHSADEIRLIIFEDGSLTNSEKMYLQDQIPGSLVVNKTERDQRLQSVENQYPNCVKFRNENVLGQKLVDLLLLGKAFIFIDSDVLFLKNFSLPEFCVPTFIKDVQNAYIFHPLKLIKQPIFPKINTGFFYFPFIQNALNKLEDLLQNKNIRREVQRLPMWAEQSLWALLAGYSAEISYFNEAQIMMAGVKPAKHIPVAIHLVSTFRYMFDHYKKICTSGSLTTEELTLISTRKKLPLWRYRSERIQKRLTRLFTVV